MKRQRLRRFLLLLGFLSLPAVLYYFSPVLILYGGSLGIVVGSAVVFVALSVCALLLGRAYCGWVCPVGGMQEACFTVNSRPARGGPGNWLKYLIFTPWVALIVYFFTAAGGPKTIDLAFQTNGGVTLGDPVSYIVYYVIVGIVLLMSVFLGRRAFCHYLCWIAPFMVIGRRIGKLLAFPALRLASDPGKCAKCKKCTNACPMSLQVDTLARAGQLDNSECILCGSCVDACPAGVIHFRFGRPHDKRFEAVGGVSKSAAPSQGPR